MTPDPLAVLQGLEKFPQLMKLRAMKLPMKTVADFLRWLKERHPNWTVDYLNVDELLYEYYQIDVQALAVELAEREKQLQK